MFVSVYYLVHQDTGQRCFRVYTSLAGARIAQRQRNRALGFERRIMRTTIEDNWEVEECELADGSRVEATYAIVEDVIENTVDLLLS
jgi:hypothetical protein